jgi:two-component system, OmpR family, phosphate regulon sensor histidine kinase PhoR
VKKSKIILRSIGATISLLIFMSILFSGAFFLTAYFYNRTGWNPSAYLKQIINSILGIIFVIAIASGMFRIARARGWAQQNRLLTPIIDALARIAKGDFTVRLDNNFGERENELFGELVTSVNRTALELDQMETMRQEFISNVSHEIQSPLTSIRGFAQALQNDRLSQEERNHYLGIIETESRRLSRITEDLLKMAALESEHATLEPRPYRLDKQIRRLILTCEPQWTEKKIDMEVDLEEIEITADEDLLSQVWNNLIHNSIKFTPSGGKIGVILRRLVDKVEFTITDSGIGISAVDQERIFERFFKADKSRTQSNGGSGLGLSIAKKIVDMHQGSISVQSQVGAGSIFTVTLPIK